VAIVNETFVREFVANTNTIGVLARTIAEPGYPETVYEVVGVVKDAKYAALREPIPPIVFVPYAQHPRPSSAAMLVVRSKEPINNAIDEVRHRIAQSNPDVTIQFRVLETQVRDGLISERVMAWLTGALGALAAMLAVIGLYGVISYTVARRRNEIGIRLALGASRRRVVLLVLRETMLLLLAGLMVGIAISLAATRVASSLLFGLSPHDAPTLIASASLLATSALLGSYIPALRASRVDPMATLREE
jgi:ABC-type antimicrobial peptide transport system permease subunit